MPSAALIKGYGKRTVSSSLYIALRNKDGSAMISVPLYVKVTEINKNGMTEAQEGVMHRISEIILKHYDKQISGYITSLKTE